MPTLVELREELRAKNDALAKIFEEAGAELDMSKVKSIDGDSAAKAAEIKRRNDELTDIGKKVDELITLDGIRKASTDRQTELKNPGTVVHPKGDNPTERKAIKGIAEMFIESAAFKDYRRADHKGPAVDLDLGDVNFKALLDTTGFAPEATRTGLILPGQLRRPVVADLIPDGRTGQNSIVYMEETTTTNNAGPVAEGAPKPESALGFEEKTSPVRKLATLLPVTDELMEDAPAMRSYVEARLRLFLQLAEETQLISGSGVAPALTGMLIQANTQTQAKAGDPTPDAVYKAMTKIAVNSLGLEASGAIFHPNDWQDIRLLRTVDGIYIWGSPSEAGPERIWGLPIVKTVAMTENTAIVAAFDTAMQIFRRNEVSFAVSDQHSDFFALNKLMLRVEERLAFVIYRPSGICTVTGI